MMQRWKGKSYEPDVGVGKDDKDKITAFLALGGGLGAGDGARRVLAADTDSEEEAPYHQCLDLHITINHHSSPNEHRNKAKETKPGREGKRKKLTTPTGPGVTPIAVADMILHTTRKPLEISIPIFLDHRSTIKPNDNWPSTIPANPIYHHPSQPHPFTHALTHALPPPSQVGWVGQGQ